MEHHPAAVRKLTDQCRRSLLARTRLLRLHRRMLMLVDSIEAARAEQGDRRFQELCPRPSRTCSRR